MSEVKALIPAQTISCFPNKDLSCLRCRKKKAKCSKTQPTCTRCARSNQSCEYPDAPPNLTDLSQKVLDLYDTLRELEGEFLVHFKQSGKDGEDSDDESLNISLSLTPPQEMNGLEPSFVLSPMAAVIQERVLDHHAESTAFFTPPAEPSDWSLSLTPFGLSLQSSAQTLAALTSFANKLAHQLCSDFGQEHLPAGWDEEDDSNDDDELDETEYLVTFPVYSISSLLCRENSHLRSTLNISTTTLNTQSNEPLTHLFESHLPAILSHLQSRLHSLDNNEAIYSVHIAALLPPLARPFLEKTYSDNKVDDLLARICLYISFIVSATLLPPLPGASKLVLPSSVWVTCATDATAQLLELILVQTEHVVSQATAMCCILLAWVDVELCGGTRASALLHLALRSLYASQDWQPNTQLTQRALAAIQYLDVSITAFLPQARQQLNLNDCSMHTWTSNCADLGVPLVSLLHKTVSLFYTADHPARVARVLPTIRKVDVDEVLNLVRDLEQWEQRLPTWAKWDADSSNNSVFDLHRIHSMVKILLYRPFCSEIMSDDKTLDEQTHTRTTFLMLSMESADRLATCLRLDLTHTERPTIHWIYASKRLINDVCQRVQETFGNDEHVAHELETIQSKLPTHLP